MQKCIYILLFCMTVDFDHHLWWHVQFCRIVYRHVDSWPCTCFFIREFMNVFITGISLLTEKHVKKKKYSAVNTKTTRNEITRTRDICVLNLRAFMLQLQKQLALHCWKQSAAAVPQRNFTNLTLGLYSI